MICFRDRCYCNFFSKCKNGNTCDRSLTDKVKSDALTWWGKSDPPICVYTDTPECFITKEIDE